MPQIVPAILTDNIEEYHHKLSLLENVVPRVQIDIIDGKFANNQTITATDIASIKTPLFLEAHVMANNPRTYIEPLVNAGVQLITFHLEACQEKEVEDILEKTHQLGIEVGIAINPETPIKAVRPFLSKIDLVLIMGVHPGFSGQTFIPETLEKIKELKKLSTSIAIEVDGGINIDNLEDVLAAGADYVVMGSSLFHDKTTKDEIKNAIELLHKKINREAVNL